MSERHVIYDRDAKRISYGKLRKQKDGSVRFVEGHDDLTLECTMAVVSMIADPDGPGATVEIGGKRYTLFAQEVKDD